jgi:hypothetical protein
MKYSDPLIMAIRLLKYTRLLTEALLPSLVASMIFYYLFYKHGIHFGEQKSSVLVVVILLGFLFPTHFLVAASTLSTSITEYKDIMAAVRDKDEEKFKKEFYRRLPTAIDVLLGLTGTLSIIIVMMIHYDDLLTGIIAVSVLTYVMYIMRQFAMGLDSPAESFLYKDKIPKEWIENLEKKTPD